MYLLTQEEREKIADYFQFIGIEVNHFSRFVLVSLAGFPLIVKDNELLLTYDTSAHPNYTVEEMKRYASYV